MPNSQPKLHRIAIIGCGFSGTSLASNIHRLSKRSIEFILYDKSGEFGVGDAYRTPYSYHLLNVRAHDMSAYVDKPNHFLDWLSENPTKLKHLSADIPLREQFVPRQLYREYLQSLLAQIKRIIYCKEEVLKVVTQAEGALIISQSGRQDKVDQVVFAIGNNPATPFPFPIHNTPTIENPWDYEAPKQIAPHESVLIMGTGLSMIDAVLTLMHQQHRGPIYALSRHGLVPLPQRPIKLACDLDAQGLPTSLRALMKVVRQHTRQHCEAGGDWQDVINTIRPHIRFLWQCLNDHDKAQFLRHGVSYWNVHRHRVHQALYDALGTAQKEQQLQIIAGRVIEVNQREATIIHRHQAQPVKIATDWVINCLGPRLSLPRDLPACLKHLYTAGEITFDSLQLGLNTDTKGAIYNQKNIPSSLYFALGSPTKGVNWECTAVPDIRVQSDVLAKHMVEHHDKEA